MAFPVADHVLERHQDGDDRMLVLRLIDVYAVFIMQREHLLPNDRNDAPHLVVELKVQRKGVAAQLPAKALKVHDVLVDVEELPGELKVGAVGQRDSVSCVQGQELPLNMSDLTACGVGDVRLVVNGEKLGVALIDRPFTAVGDVDVVVKGEDLCGCEKRSLGLSEALYVVDVRVFSCLTESVLL